jgi:hypothetical protein
VLIDFSAAIDLSLVGGAKATFPLQAPATMPLHQILMPQVSQSALCSALSLSLSLIHSSIHGVFCLMCV